ncbi:MAG: alkaline phytoceramidase [Planctomycetota bacterium]|nr:alkaline phytoceramidase [Planctomycetota bacterium]
MDRRTRLLLAFLPGLIALPVLFFVGPISQNPCYHNFADQRVVWGIPYFGDVVTNLPFVIVGIWGLCLRPPRDWAVFFLGLALTGIGSGYYHLDPTNTTLVWDRLPMTLAFMGFFAALIRERVDERVGRALLWPLVIAGTGTVGWWALTDDLRAYGLVQFYPMVATVLLLWLLPGPRKSYLLALVSYVLAKVTELLDWQIWNTNEFASGHNLKHLFAALAGVWIIGMLRARKRAEAPPA